MTRCRGVQETLPPLETGPRQREWGPQEVKAQGGREKPSRNHQPGSPRQGPTARQAPMKREETQKALGSRGVRKEGNKGEKTLWGCQGWVRNKKKKTKKKKKKKSHIGPGGNKGGGGIGPDENMGRNEIAKWGFGKKGGPRGGGTPATAHGRPQKDHPQC